LTLTDSGSVSPGPNPSPATYVFPPEYLKRYPGDTQNVLMLFETLRMLQLVPVIVQ
jgi:hypothetical protein